MYSRINYTVVGLFVTLFTLALFAFGFWLAKYGFEQKYNRYYLYFTEPVNGLTVDSSVKLNGVDVGKVSSIEIDPDNVARIRVLIRLREGTPITKGMYALLNLQGITGLSYVEIEGGKKGEESLRPVGDEIPVIPTRESLIHKLGKGAPELLKKLEKAADNLSRILSDKNRILLTEILENTAKATGKAEKVEDRIIALAADFNRTLRHFDRRVASVVEEVNGVTKTLNDKLPPLLDHFDKAGQNITLVAEGIDRRLKRGEYDLKKIVRPLKIDLQELSYRYQELAEDLKSLSQNPSSILFGSGHPVKGPGE